MKELLISIAIVFLIQGCASQKAAEVVIHKSIHSQIAETKNPYKIRVKKGETLYSIAKTNNVEIRSLIDTNRLRAPFLLQPGQKLFLPKPAFHTVIPGDTIYAISRSYGLNMNRIIAVNSLSAPYSLRKGQKIRLPSKVAASDGEAITMAEVKEEELAVVKVKELKPLRRASKSNIPRPQLKAQKNFAKPKKYSKKYSKRKTTSYRPANFKWPTNGRIISRFGPKKGGLYNDGINISAPAGTKINAADNGTVVYAGNELRGYGNLLLIKHDNGYLTAYAHTKNTTVSKGERVLKGQKIAEVGSSGHVNKPQLHFSIRKGRKAINPLKYLPKKG